MKLNTVSKLKLVHDKFQHKKTDSDTAELKEMRNDCNEYLTCKSIKKKNQTQSCSVKTV